VDYLIEATFSRWLCDPLDVGKRVGADVVVGNEAYAFDLAAIEAYPSLSNLGL
jgi:hypothetical protein